MLTAAKEVTVLEVEARGGRVDNVCISDTCC